MDDISTQQGYREGEKELAKKEALEGFELGVKKGQEIGSEIGFYHGFARFWIRANNRPKKEDEEEGQKKKSVLKAVKVLEKLEKSCDEFPSENSKDADHLLLLEEIRAKFKLSCQLLNIKLDYNSSSSKDISW